MESETDLLQRVIHEVFGEISDAHTASLLCSLLYNFAFGVRKDTGEVVEVELSTRSAALIVEKLFNGSRPELLQVTTPGYEYAYWMRMVNDYPDATERARMEVLADMLRQHKAIAHATPTW